MGFLNGFKFCCCFLFLFWIWFCSGDLFTDCTVVNHHHLPPFWSLLDFFPTIEHANPSCCEVIFAFELYEGERRSQSFGKGAAKISKMTPTYPGNMYFWGVPGVLCSRGLIELSYTYAFQHRSRQKKQNTSKCRAVGL